MGGTILNAKRWHLSKDDTERKERIDIANRISNAVAAGVTFVHLGSERTSRAKMCSERAQVCNLATACTNFPIKDLVFSAEGYLTLRQSGP